MEEKTFTVGAQAAGQRADKYLSEAVPDLSRAYIQKLAAEGKVGICDNRAGSIPRPVKSNYRLKEGDRLQSWLSSSITSCVTNFLPASISEALRRRTDRLDSE